MGRKKIENKNQVISISLPYYQCLFIKSNKVFDLSKFVQIHLQSFIDLYDYNQKEVKINNDKKKIK
ncbi:hypothetical protein KAI04_04865 [Candidatus Pacearchaeota archaeon]|nr:hypothetical protein [Candidatus Pacearchaeota archaeon]